MKQTFLIFLMPALFFFTNCGDNKASTNEKQQANSSSSETKKEPASNSSAQDNDITGEWELVGFIGDTNDNLQIDEDERKNLKTPSYKDYMKLNRHGSGLFTVGQLEGRYEAKAKESGGKKYLTWYDKANGEHRIGTILSVTKNELTIKEPGGNGLFLWKRV
jgi:hypothetical protein